MYVPGSAIGSVTVICEKLRLRFCKTLANAYLSVVVEEEEEEDIKLFVLQVINYI